jgi:hypothetical protein
MLNKDYSPIRRKWMAKKGASLSFTAADGTQVTISNENAEHLLSALKGNARPVQGMRQPMMRQPIARQPIVRPPMTQPVARVQPVLPQRRIPIYSADKGIKKAPHDMVVLIRKGESVIVPKKKRKWLLLTLKKTSKTEQLMLG